MSIRRHAPMLGENTEEVLAEVGYDEEEIERITWG
jgi:crotonobetainyl-CoA:carnitine CoA-transferase CaiB-like acyl-CoA transferase